MQIGQWPSPIERSLVLAALTLLLTPQVAVADGGWIRATDSGCLVWDARPQPDETVTWSGVCVEGKSSGFGTEIFRYRDGSVWKQERYDGEMKDGRPDGRGTLSYDNGDRFTGNFTAGLRVGLGTYVHANGDRYAGNFQEDQRTGQGTFTYRNGARYEGGFVNGRFEGFGTFSFADGGKYAGNFRGGMANGPGTYTSKSGETLAGAWSNGCLQKGNHVAAVGITPDKCRFR